MGLDISFNKEQAVKAGMELSTKRIGTNVQIYKARKLEDGNSDYLKYLLEEETLASFAEYDHFFAVSEGTDQDGNTILFAGANLWGNLYEPLTTFLRTNNIEWGEG